MDRINFNSKSGDSEKPDLLIDIDGVSELSESVGMLAGGIETLGQSVDDLGEAVDVLDDSVSKTSGLVGSLGRDIDDLGEAVDRFTRAVQLIAMLAVGLLGALGGWLIFLALNG